MSTRTVLPVIAVGWPVQTCQKFGPLVLFGGMPAEAADAGLLAEPWVVRDEAEKPVRGGYLRTAAAQYIGNMNPNHWPVFDWLTMGLFHEKLLITDGS